MMNIEDESCKTCKFYKDDSCKRYPPIICYELTYDRYGETKISTYSDYPVVEEENWCGEYKKDN